VNEWSSALGVQLTVNCYICERHFRPQDFIFQTFFVDGIRKEVKLLVHPVLPILNNGNNLPGIQNILIKINFNL